MYNAQPGFKEIRLFDLTRKVVAHKTFSSWKSKPHVTYIYEPDITEFYRTFEYRFKNDQEEYASEAKLSFNTVIIKAITEALKAAPALNAYVNYNAGSGTGRLLVCEEINISIAWLLADRRMITPVLANAGELSLRGLSDLISTLAIRIEKTNIDEMLLEAVFWDTIHEMKKLNISMIKRIIHAKWGPYKLNRLKGQARKEYYSIAAKERLTGKDIMNGTITISNIGSLYKEQKGFLGMLEIIEPQVCAIGIGAIQEKAGVYCNEKGGSEIGIRKMLPICIAFDHRAGDFDMLVPFLKYMDHIFANPDIINSW